MFMRKVRNYRRELHQIPELGFDLPKTHAYVKQRLTEMGYEPTTIAETGLYVYIEGQSNETIAFRADMDALSVTEKTQAEYTSRHQGKMHACGHDGHMAMLLGLAEKLSTFETFNQSILLIFQPAEEGPGGAETIVNTGLLQHYNVQKIFGFHLYPNLEEGKIGLVEGPMMAQNGEFDVFIKGVSSHSAQPQNGRDAMNAGLKLVQRYQDIVTQMTDPLVPSMIAIGTFNAGEARNVVAQDAQFTGTIRSFDGDTYNTITDSMKRLAESVSVGYDVDIRVDIRNFYPAVMNDKALYDDAVQAIPSHEQAVIKPMMFAEDFAFYQQVVPGLFMMLGTQKKEQDEVHPLHSCYFDFDERVLVKGVQTYMRLLYQYNVVDDHYHHIYEKPSKKRPRSISQ